MKLGSSRGMDTKPPRGSERSKPRHELQLTRPSQPPYPWPPEQAQPGVSKPCRTTDAIPSSVSFLKNFIDFLGGRRRCCCEARISAGAGLFTQHGLLIPGHHLRQAHILRDKVAYEIKSARSEKISLLTLEHYNLRAEEFWKGTRYHNVSQNIEALLQPIEGKPPFTILDFGCGPGRDLKAFVEQGHNAIGLEGAEHFVTMARAYSGREVWRQDFLKLALPEKHFDGVFADAALFHVPRQELPRVLLELHATLKPGGVLFSSNPRGDNEEGWTSGRYSVFHDLDRGAVMRQRRDSLS